MVNHGYFFVELLFVEYFFGRGEKGYMDGYIAVCRFDVLILVYSTCDMR